jgi:hypothetical protein
LAHIFHAGGSTAPPRQRSTTQIDRGEASTIGATASRYRIRSCHSILSTSKRSSVMRLRTGVDIVYGVGWSHRTHLRRTRLPLQTGDSGVWSGMRPAHLSKRFGQGSQFVAVVTELMWER